MGKKLTELAGIIRSKNAGPYELTLDIMFNEKEWFQEITEAKVINKELISRIYKMPQSDIIEIIEFEPASAIKITLKRPVVSGDIGETDVYGAQQHAPLLGLEFEL